MKQTDIRISMSSKQVRGVKDSADSELLDSLGIGIKSGAMDALPLTVTTANTGTPVQFLQTWIPEAIYIATAPRKADEVMGRDIIGRWEDEEIVRKVVERTGQASLYTDTGNVPLSDDNVNFETRSVVRLEKGVQVLRLEEARASAMQINTEKEKRDGASEALAIGLNNIAFYGVNNGENRTYGYFNDPYLPAYVTVANGASGDSEWSTKTFAEIIADLQTAISQLIKQSNGLFDPKRDDFKLVIPPQQETFLSTPSTQYGATVIKWINENYPKMEIVTAPQLTAANGGVDVFYMHADYLNGQKVMSQNVQTVFMFLGFEKKAKGNLEDYTAATAGFMLNMPIGLVRYSGI